MKWKSCLSCTNDNRWHCKESLIATTCQSQFIRDTAVSCSSETDFILNWTTPSRHSTLVGKMKMMVESCNCIIMRHPMKISGQIVKDALSNTVDWCFVILHVAQATQWPLCNFPQYGQVCYQSNDKGQPQMPQLNLPQHDWPPGCSAPVSKCCTERSFSR